MILKGLRKKGSKTPCRSYDQISCSEIIQNIKIKKMSVESIVMHYEQGEILDNDGSYKNYIQV